MPKVYLSKSWNIETREETVFVILSDIKVQEGYARYRTVPFKPNCVYDQKYGQIVVFSFKSVNVYCAIKGSVREKGKGVWYRLTAKNKRF